MAAIKISEGFNLGYCRALPGKGPMLHNHDTNETFICMTGVWRASWENEKGRVEHVDLKPLDVISFRRRLAALHEREEGPGRQARRADVRDRRQTRPARNSPANPWTSWKHKASGRRERGQALKSACLRLREAGVPRRRPSSCLERPNAQSPGGRPEPDSRRSTCACPSPELLVDITGIPGLAGISLLRRDSVRHRRV
jgi:hypothetical protein